MADARGECNRESAIFFRYFSYACESPEFCGKRACG
jgi:hypothetical protein